MRRRLVLLVMVFMWFRLDAAPAAAVPYPDECAEVCDSESDCNTPCFETFSDFESEIWSSCGDYEVCGYTSYCGDSVCDHLYPIYWETPGSCAQDCPGACTPNWTTDYEPIAGFFDELCVEIPGETPDGSGESEALYWCDCKARTLYIAYYHDLNMCEGNDPSYYCVDFSAGNEFGDYNDTGDGWCCEQAPAYCWGGSCPY